LLVRTGDVAGARAVLQVAVDGSMLARYRLALLLRGQGETTAADHLLEEVAGAGGSVAAAAMVALALLRWREGDPAAAVELSRAPAVQASPYAGRAAVNLDAVLAEQGDSDAAVAAWRQALQSTDPKINTAAAVNLAAYGNSSELTSNASRRFNGSPMMWYRQSTHPRRSDHSAKEQT
jgi:tetratricopeptide (TPR) repeat protein